jgi:hypothetical protein
LVVLSVHSHRFAVVERERCQSTWWMGSNGYMMVDGTQVENVLTVSQSKSNIVWIYNTVCTGYTCSLLSALTYCTTLAALATLAAHSLLSPTVLHCMHWLHLQPTLCSLTDLLACLARDSERDLYSECLVSV